MSGRKVLIYMLILMLAILNIYFENTKNHNCTNFQYYNLVLKKVLLLSSNIIIQYLLKVLQHL